MKLAVLFLVAGLSGCGFRSQTTESGTAVGKVNGAPFAVQWTRDSEGVKTLALPEMSGAASMLPSPWGDIATLGLALLGGGGLAAARGATKRAAEHKEDAKEGWELAMKGRSA